MNAIYHGNRGWRVPFVTKKLRGSISFSIMRWFTAPVSCTSGGCCLPSSEIALAIRSYVSMLRNVACSRCALRTRAGRRELRKIRIHRIDWKIHGGKCKFSCVQTACNLHVIKINLNWNTTSFNTQSSKIHILTEKTFMVLMKQPCYDHFLRTF